MMMKAVLGLRNDSMSGDFKNYNNRATHYDILTYCLNYLRLIRKGINGRGYIDVLDKKKWFFIMIIIIS